MPPKNPTAEPAPAPASPPPTPLPGTDRSLWWLDPDITFLNHGSFGACPKRVLDAQDQYRRDIESRPIEVLGRGAAERLNAARDVVGRRLGMSSSDFGFLTNATAGVNAVLRSLTFSPGDEIVTTNHVYNAVWQSMRHIADRVGAHSIEVDIPLPITTDNAIFDAIEAGLTSRTRLVIVDHITSPTAVVFPVRRIVEHCHERGIDVLIDGAHAPGMIDLDIASLAPAYYTGNLHKWICAPKGAGFLWVRPDRQADVHPLIISHPYRESTFADEFDWQGTHDITAWQAAADAMTFLEQFGWSAFIQHNHDLAVWAQRMLCDAWGVESATPLDGGLIGSMATVPLPAEIADRFSSADAVQAALLEQARIEVPIVDWSDRWWVRVSCQIYNRPEDYERLADAVSRMAR